MASHSVVLADDHALIRTALTNLVNSFDDYHVLFHCANGEELIAALNPSLLPDIILLDVNMPRKNGFETAEWLQQHYPDIRILVLSMYENENSIVRMLQFGVRGYILKDAEPAELKAALDAIITKGYHYSDLITGHLIRTVTQGTTKTGNTNVLLTAREIEFLRYACTDMGYKEIGDRMCVSPRTVEGYRDALCEKLDIKTRIGLAVYAMKNGLVDMHK
jgi:DNA-binding NarL/FixJ family response regulator